MSRAALQATLAGLGAAAAVAGARGVLSGPAELPAAGSVSAAVDSEYRFYAAWYHLAGLALLAAARRPEERTAVVRGTAAGFTLAFCGRLLSRRAGGRPQPFQEVLTALELAIR